MNSYCTPKWFIFIISTVFLFSFLYHCGECERTTHKSCGDDFCGTKWRPSRKKTKYCSITHSANGRYICCHFFLSYLHCCCCFFFCFYDCNGNEFLSRHLFLFIFPIQWSTCVWVISYKNSQLKWMHFTKDVHSIKCREKREEGRERKCGNREKSRDENILLSIFMNAISLFVFPFLLRNGYLQPIQCIHHILYSNLCIH